MNYPIEYASDGSPMLPVDLAYQRGIEQMGKRGPQVTIWEWLDALAHMLQPAAATAKAWPMGRVPREFAVPQTILSRPTRHQYTGEFNVRYPAVKSNPEIFFSTEGAGFNQGHARWATGQRYPGSEVVPAEPIIPTNMPVIDRPFGFVEGGNRVRLSDAVTRYLRELRR